MIEIVIAGEPEDETARGMLKVVGRRFLPRAVVLLHPEGERSQDIEKIAPWVKEQPSIGGKTTAYVCENFSCKLPVTKTQKLVELLG